MEQVKNTTNKIINSEYFVIVLGLLFILYASIFREDMPEYIRRLFANNIFRIFFLSLLLIYNFNTAPHVAVFIAGVFVITMYYINEREKKEHMMQIQEYFKN